ncbi:MAG: hypothetical protein RIM23_03450 [Coleofasciculus sp. G3-WIS-01]|uniref:hypothetical protein n=1 Tax=Coleofasciculus sp. G3-WIS-01 TaxID=3069528 RepID=UPI0032F0B85D
MNYALRQKVCVKPGGIIEIHSHELPPGAVADVIIILETPPNKQQSLTRLIGTAKGSFATPEAADNFISQERDTWSY